MYQYRKKEGKQEGELGADFNFSLAAKTLKAAAKTKFWPSNFQRSSCSLTHKARQRWVKSIFCLHNSTETIANTEEFSVSMGFTDFISDGGLTRGFPRLAQ